MKRRTNPHDRRLHSEATSIGMRRWWRQQPLCLACGKVRIRNPLATQLCARCRRRSQRAKSQVSGDGVWATIMLNPTPNVKSYRLRPFRRLEGWLSRVCSDLFAGDFEFSNDWLGTLSLEEEDFEVVEVHERRNEP